MLFNGEGALLSEVAAIVVVVAVGVGVKEVLVVVLGVVEVVVEVVLEVVEVVVVVVLVVVVRTTHASCCRVWNGISRSGSRLPWHGQSCFSVVSAHASIWVRPSSPPPHTLPSVLFHSDHLV